MIREGEKMMNEENKKETYFEYYSKTPERIAEFMVACQSMCDYCIFVSECDSQQSGVTCLHGVASGLKLPKETE